MTIWLLILKILTPAYQKHNKFWFKGVFSLNIYYIKYIPTNILDHVDDEKDYLYLFLHDLDRYTEENDGIKYLVFASTDKNKETLKNTQNFGKKLKDKLK